MVAISSQFVSVETFQPARSCTPLKEQARAFDMETFNGLILEYQDRVFRQACWILGDEVAAEDAVQEAFLRAYRNMNTYNGGPFLPWVLRITTNYCFDQLRRQKVRKSIPLQAVDENEEEIETPPWVKDQSTSVEETLMRSEEQAWVMKCLNRLPPEYKTAIVLVDLQEIKYTQAAESMGIGLGTFKSRLSRARELLQRYLQAGQVLN